MEQSKAGFTWRGSSIGSVQRAYFLYGKICSPVPTAGKTRGLMFMCHDFSLQIQFPSSGKRSKEEGKKVGSGWCTHKFYWHRARTCSWIWQLKHTFRSPAQRTTNLMARNSTSDRCWLMSTWCEMKSFFSVCQIVTFWFGLSWPETKHSVLIFLIQN